ncbi:MAG: hypothetical protein ACKOED_03240 [Aestuariivirga sp.]|uniref:hypothetical protein n=1 Tax=Aestuariivirga sp. TaxID=2650926 RepID=UPI0038D0C9D1
MNRQVLMASVAAGALMLVLPNPAAAQAVPPFTPPNPCVVTGLAPDKIVTCTGIVAGGVNIANQTTATYRTLIVKDLQQDINAYTVVGSLGGVDKVDSQIT